MYLSPLFLKYLLCPYILGCCSYKLRYFSLHLCLHVSLHIVILSYIITKIRKLTRIQCCYLIYRPDSPVDSYEMMYFLSREK